MERVYLDGHGFQQDNDPKHTSRYAQDYIEENEINLFKTPASSSDLNPIELFWHALTKRVQTQELWFASTGLQTLGVQQPAI